MNCYHFKSVSVALALALPGDHKVGSQQIHWLRMQLTKMKFDVVLNNLSGTY